MRIQTTPPQLTTWRPESAPAATKRAESAQKQVSDSMDKARLDAVVELIKKLTGREVALVPPSPYFVSAPAKPEPVKTDVELTVVNDVEIPQDDRRQPLTIDINEVIRNGTSKRMRLSNEPGIGLKLQPELDVEL